MKKFAILCGAIAVSALSHASYELMLVCDNADRVIHRVDPVSGAYLGSFGKGFLSFATHVAVNPANGLAYVYDSGNNKVLTFDYSTGLYRSSFSTAGLVTLNGSFGYLSVASNGDVLLGVSYGGGFRLNASGAVIAQYGVPAGGTGLTKVIQGADGAIYGVDWIGKRVARYNFAGGAPTSYSSANQAYWDLAAFGSLGLGLSETAVTKLNMNAGMASISSQPLTQFGLNAAQALARGHGNMSFVGGWTGSGYRIVKFDGTDYQNWGYIEHSAIKNITGIATVVAPEPGTMIALSLGVAVLARRRRR